MSYHEEQETLDELRAWWARWGNLVTWIALAVLLALAAYNGWQYWQRRQAAQASQLYEQFEQAAASGERARVTRIAQDMRENFGRTAYASMTELAAASTLYRAGDAAGAKVPLQWVIDHSSDKGYQALARLHLAGVWLDERAFDKGLALLDGKAPAGFDALYADRRGDLLAASGKTDAARQAYRDALKALSANEASFRQMVQFKLDSMGG